MNSQMIGKRALLPSGKFMSSMMALCAILCLNYTNIFAQNIQARNISQQKSSRTIKGLVMDNLGPLTGATIMIKGTQLVTVADENGFFTIEIPKDKSMLVISYYGMETMEIKIGDKTYYEILMIAEEESGLEGIIVYGQKIDRRSYTGSIGTVTSDDIRKRPTTAINNTLSGRKAGIQVTGTIDRKERASDITMRGQGSLSASSSPLIVIDGTPYSGNINSINPRDVKNISVLNDASAKAVYGSRGANGVVVIQTKNGKLSKPISHNFFNKTFRAKLLKKITYLQTPLKEQPQENNSYTNESYEVYEENAFASPLNQPLSTFSIDVDRAAYANIRRFINNGIQVPKDAVRIEEMINYFSYNYIQPEAKKPFGLYTELSQAPWNEHHQLLKIGLQAKDIPKDKLPSGNLVFLIDVSGSMSEYNKLPLLKKAFGMLVSTLRPQDKVSIVVYAGAAGLILPPTSGENKSTILAALEQLQSGGSTAGGQGIELAYKIARENFISGGNNRVILATDGDFNVGASSDADMQKLIEERREDGVFLTCLGFGMGNYKDSKMELLANKGNGNYAYIDNEAEAQKILQKEFGGTLFTVAKDVKIQIEFNPDLVASYRLIGYENRILNAEDFANDAVDAGEMGSGHSVTALYEIIPVGASSKYMPKVEALKYSKVKKSTAAFHNELALLKYRYKLPDANKSTELVQSVPAKMLSQDEISQGFKLASSVAWFGLKLRDSNLIENKDIGAIRQYVKNGVMDDNSEQKQLKELVERYFQ